MKKTFKKIVLGVLGGLLVGGAYLNYRMAQPKQPMSDLTLANIEAMADEEEQGARNAASIDTQESEGKPYKINGRTCVDFHSSVSCIGSGSQFCMTESRSWTECY